MVNGPQILSKVPLLYKSCLIVHKAMYKKLHTVVQNGSLDIPYEFHPKVHLMMQHSALLSAPQCLWSSIKVRQKEAQEKP